jgi:hypothetical protein
MKISWCSLLLLLVSCAPRQDAWERVSSNPTMPTLRRYIMDHPGTEETQIARLHLERLSARAALAAGGIAPLQLHLQAYPAGAHAAEVRGRLMVLRAARALAEDTPWALLRFLYLHPDSKETAAVRARLEETWWKQLQADPSAHGLKQYLEVFPTGGHETEAQELLAHVIFEKLGPEPDPELLRMFVLNHPKSPTGKRALALLREWERSEVLVSGETTTVVELLRRGESLPAELVRVSFAAHLEAALWSFDLDLLGQLCDAAPRQCDAQLPAAIQYWKKMAPQARDRLAETVRAAGPFRPMPAFRTLEVALNVEDLHTVWVALRSLSHRPEPRAFALLLSRAGHPDSAIAWPAADACRAWLARWPSRGAVLAAFELRRRQNRRDQFPSLIQTALLAEFLQRPLPAGAALHPRAAGPDRPGRPMERVCHRDQLLDLPAARAFPRRPRSRLVSTGPQPRTPDVPVPVAARDAPVRTGALFHGGLGPPRPDPDAGDRVGDQACWLLRLHSQRRGSPVLPDPGP